MCSHHLMQTNGPARRETGRLCRLLRIRGLSERDVSSGLGLSSGYRAEAELLKSLSYG